MKTREIVLDLAISNRERERESLKGFGDMGSIAICSSMAPCGVYIGVYIYIHAEASLFMVACRA